MALNVNRNPGANSWEETRQQQQKKLQKFVKDTTTELDNGSPISEEKINKAKTFLNKNYFKNKPEYGYEEDKIYYFIDKTDNSKNGMIKGICNSIGFDGGNFNFEYIDNNGNKISTTGFKSDNEEAWWRNGNPFGWGSALTAKLGGKKTHKKTHKKIFKKKNKNKKTKTRRQKQKNKKKKTKTRRQKQEDKKL